MGIKTSVVIDVQNVRKKFRVYYDRGTTLKERLLFRKRRTYEDHWVLKGISFQVHEGEAIGLIGENGCGKSTTLKMLTKILYPDAGRITMKGRVSSLIELGAGFHPDMTGRENIYTNASIFGLKREEIDRRLQEIIDFSELGDCIDNPVRTYSSGMYMRLAFAVAINVDADILLIDEILAVGDMSYQTKCFNKLREIKSKGTTIVIVSHSLDQIEEFCDASYWVCDGVIRAYGNPRDVHLEYKQFMMEKSMAVLEKENQATTPEAEIRHQAEKTIAETGDSEGHTDEKTSTKTGWQLAVTLDNSPGAPRHFGTGKAMIDEVQMINQDRKVTTIYQTGQDVTVRYRYRFYEKANEPCCGITIYRIDGIHCYGVNSNLDGIPWSPEEEGTVSICIHRLPLLQGEYMLDVAIAEKGNYDCDYYKNVLKFTVLPNSEERGIITIPHEWHFEGG